MSSVHEPAPVAAGAPPLAGTVPLLRELIRNACVNDGRPESGQEHRSVATLREHFAGSDFEYEVIEPAPGRTSLVGRIRGTDPSAPSLALVGHLDVVPVDESGWRHDPFGAEIVDGEVWGRGAVDMLNLTAAMAVVTRALAAGPGRLRGDLVFAAVADEEAGGRFGAGWISAHRPDLIRADYALTENGGVVLGGGEQPGITLTVGEKGGAARQLEVTGRPGHGSTPYGAQNAAVLAARVVQAIADDPGEAVVLDHWRAVVAALDLPPSLRARLTDPATLNAALPELGELAGYAHALTHATIAPTTLHSGAKRNVIPGTAGVGLDVRLLPGQRGADVDAHLRRVLEPWSDAVEIVAESDRAASVSPADTPLADAIAAAVRGTYPGARLVPVMMPGGTDGRHLRELGSVVYGFGLFSRDLGLAEFRRRFHGNDERIDLTSVELTTTALYDTVVGLLGEQEQAR
ncbi:M20/M25/M40 family metallo-hydrolase [Nakamurella leprariae]|uniref:M20/M25/M40 family metallo-hydrolase n=1 Tax=Nakamurella leprariae TaxID=2803911 RepID=A0A938YBE9_9ACTN|nr:M20/M25/M40 family metallo-hydrolase [Nakamurella leprariae]MBM9466714.1 M20/M25/M40 family metallo-hydrolase [Nakamurella leprariae]